MRRTSSSLGPGANVPPCTAANQRPVMVGSRSARRRTPREIALRERRQQCHQHDVRDALDVALGRRRKAGERCRFGAAADARRGAGDGDHAAPRGRERQACKQWSDRRRSSARRPPSTTRPPPANVQVPMAERRARPTARARSGASVGSAVAARPVHARRPARAACPSRARHAAGARDARDTCAARPRGVVVVEESPRETGGAFGILAADRRACRPRAPTRAASVPAPPRRCRRTGGQASRADRARPKCRRAAASTNTVRSSAMVCNRSSVGAASRVMNRRDWRA